MWSIIAKRVASVSACPLGCQGPLLHSRVHGSSCSADQQILGICFVLPEISEPLLLVERYGEFGCIEWPYWTIPMKSTIGIAPFYWIIFTIMSTGRKLSCPMTIIILPTCESKLAQHAAYCRYLDCSDTPVNYVAALWPIDLQTTPFTCPCLLTVTTHPLSIPQVWLFDPVLYKENRTLWQQESDWFSVSGLA